MLEIRPASEHDNVRRGQLEIENEINAVGAGLVDLRGQHIRSIQQQSGAGVSGVKSVFAPAIDVGGRERQVIDRSRRHVVAEDFGAIQINHYSVVAHHTDHQLIERGRIGHHEGGPKIGGQILVVGIGSVADGRGDRLIAIAITQARRAGRPGRVVENRGLPNEGKIRAGVQVFPDRAGGNKHGSACAIGARVVHCEAGQQTNQAG